ncbi:MAG TPA: hypothetical protein DDW93_00930 [Firmicutes bacterium]|jgi:hypothetical protein|nr:hypothetical protein [Bacillota bacterium]HBK68103.1 hypothetical protein [Bacillota bacterium]HBT15724.1 hypothetical protein [Bacillota bacterium]
MENKCSCSFCGNLTFGGLRIHGELICPACEGRLAQLQIEDEDYKDWLGHLRSMWLKWMKPEHPGF